MSEYTESLIAQIEEIRKSMPVDSRRDILKKIDALAPKESALKSVFTKTVNQYLAEYDKMLEWNRIMTKTS